VDEKTKGLFDYIKYIKPIYKYIYTYKLSENNLQNINYLKYNETNNIESQFVRKNFCDIIS